MLPTMQYVGQMLTSIGWVTFATHELEPRVKARVQRMAERCPSRTFRIVREIV